MEDITAVLRKQATQEFYDILNNAHRIPQKGYLVTEKYSIEHFMLALELKLIQPEKNGYYELTAEGEADLHDLEDELFSIRSKNNNVFVYSSYWRSWSRVLLHTPSEFGPGRSALERHYDSLGLSYIYETLELGTHNWVEIDLTAINPGREMHWRSNVQYGNIRCHNTQLGCGRDIVGTLPGRVVKQMEQWLTPQAIEILLHADLLPYIDFNKARKNRDSGFRFADAAKQCCTPQQYLNGIRASGGGPGILMHDVQEAYDALKADWDAKISKLTIREGLR